MKKEIIQLAVAGACGVGVLASLAFQPAGRKIQVNDTVKPESVAPLLLAPEAEPVKEIDSIQLYRQAIKEINQDTRKTVTRINRKINLLQSEMMRSSLASIWPDDRVIPPPVVGIPLPLPEPKLDSLPGAEPRRGLFRRRK